MSILDLFCSVDAFWQRFEPRWERELLCSGARQRRRASRLHPAEILTILSSSSNPGIGRSRDSTRSTSRSICARSFLGC
jgi:hypothetical protein